MRDATSRALQVDELEYPARLAVVDGAPPVLWMTGGWRPAARAVAIVGSRAATRRGLDLAESMATELVRRGVDVISGGALGVDAAAHRGALDGDRGSFTDGGSPRGHTVAVLGTGIDVVYPHRHAALFAEIVASGGALVTQFPPGTGPHAHTFPVRNRVIAALSDVVVVVEAGLESGALYTARAANGLERRLCAVPGSPGADRLIIEGATPILDVDDLLAVLEDRAPAVRGTPRDSDAARLHAALDAVPRDVGDLAFRAGLGLAVCAARVADLELGGLCARAPGGRYVRLR